MQENTVTYNIAEVFNPQDSVFVSANAGAGKTSLLTNRVLSLLLHGVPASKILCLTFTNAAAAEMANRVQAELGAWVMASESSLADKIAHLNHTPNPHTLSRARSLFATVLESPEGVRIQTLHGLCQSLLRRFPVEAGISPHFTIMDGRTEQEILHEARQRLFARAQEHDAGLREALQILTQSHGEDSIRQLLQTIIRSRRAILPLFSGSTRAHAPIAEIWKLLGLAQGASLDSLLDAHFSYTDSGLATLRAITAQLLSGKLKRDDKRSGEALQKWLESQPTRHQHVHEYVQAFITAAGTPYKSISNSGTLSADLAEQLAAEQQRILSYAQSANAHAIATRTSHMLTIADALLALYAKLKHDRALMDYEDLIMHAVDLLRNKDVIPWVLYKLDGGIDHLLVDEAQDTSPEQWSIIDALTGEFFAGQGRAEQDRSLFVVGDEKQSIFSFQGADPRELGKARDRFKQVIANAGKNAHNVELTRSFRSTGPVLQAVDAVFALPLAYEGFTYSGLGISHILHRDAPGLVELWPAILRNKEESGEAEPDTTSNHIKLARTVADAIKGWLDSGLMLESKKRPVQPGDIMILVRNRAPLVDPLVRALKKRGVPVAGHDRMQLGENLAVQDLIALGQCLLLPEDDLTLAALLKSPLFALTEDELFQLAHAREKHSLWERLQSQQSLSANTARAYTLLTDLRARADYISPFELYSYLLENRGGRAAITGRMGEEYHDPLDEFLNLALLYEHAHIPSLQGFIHWLNASESEIRRDMEQAQACVRILTVHASKGLEAPIVILPDTTKKPDMKDMLLWHEGQGGRLPFWPGGSKSDDPFCARLRQRRYADIMGEYRRLLYVALTRARDRLYIFGAANAQKVGEESWYDLITAGLSQIAIPFHLPWGDGLRLGEIPELANPEIEEFSLPQETAEFPYLTRPAPADPVPPQPLAPSRLVGEEPAAASPLNALGLYRRGTLIHQLLQYLPQVPPQMQPALATKLTTPHALPEADAATATAEALRVIVHPDYAFLFTPEALAEVPVAGLVTVAGKKVAVSGQIDRLHIGESEVWIVDFKSNHTPPDAGNIPSAYIRQMRLYQLLLQQIYPGKRVVCALLWTATATISVLPQSQLDEVPASSYI